MNKHKKRAIIELKTLTDLWANFKKVGKHPLPKKHNGTRHPKTVTDDEEK